MMKIRSLLIAIPVLTLCIGCAKEPTAEVELPNSDLIPLNISGSISQVQTKATAEGFVDKDALGLFAVNYSGNNTVAGTLITEGNQADNVKYVFDETNQKWNPVKAVYYKDVNTNADLYVYYPFQSSINDVNAANFEVKQDQSSPKTETELSGYEASDFLWGKASNIAPSEAKVAISLFHKLSSVQVTLVEGTGFDESEFADLEKSLILTNTTRKATIDYATGEATPLGNPQLNGIVMCPQEDGAFRAIVIPQTVTGGEKLFAITLGGTSYSFSQSADVTYQAGKQMNVSISVNKKVPTGEYELVLADTQIVDWVEDRNTHGGEARQYFVVNVETPGTLGATIEAMGKNPAKIKNLKVTGQITTEDFYFMRDEMTILEAINLKEVKVKDCYELGFPTEKDGIVDYWDKGVYDDIIPNHAFENKTSLWYFVFPEQTKAICGFAFNNTSLSGNIVIPDDVKKIERNAFSGSSIVTISFPSRLEYIGSFAFEACSFLTNFSLPSSLTYIGAFAFAACSFYGRLDLPENLEYIGYNAFQNFGTIMGTLMFPDKVLELPECVFYNTDIRGNIILNNVTKIGYAAFTNCRFVGELIIPDGTQSIPNNAFDYAQISSLVLPESLKEIGREAFDGCGRLHDVQWNNNLMLIGENAFRWCSSINEIHLPASLVSIQANAFYACSGISSIVSEAVVPPTTQTSAFDGVPKDNFTLEVPAGSVSRYQGASGWLDFRRISAHYDFSISRSLLRGQNAEKTRTYTLRCPAGYDWSIESKPDWVTVSPDHGTGKTDVTVTISEMARTSEPMMNLDNIYEQIGVGRNGEIVFKLDDKDYTCTMAVEQYDSDYADGQSITLQTASKGDGIDIVFIGDGYDAKDIADGAFIDNVNSGYASYFDVEPYKTYKDYFNVYAVVSESEDSGIGTVNTVKDSKFGSRFTQNRILLEEPGECFSWAANAKSSIDFTKSLVILLQNAPVYEGVTMMYGDGSAIACCPISEDPYPYDFRGIIQHEAGGHGFGKLGDEYIYHNAFIQTCNCICCEHPQSDNDLNTSYGLNKSRGWYKNLSMSSDPNLVPWSHLLYNPQYSDYVDMFEGGYMHSRGMYRSEASSCMNNNIPYYSAISRQAIVERIMEYAGEEFTLEKFYAKDSNEFGTKAAEPVSRKYVPEQIPFDGRERNIPIYMGEHPEL